MPAVRRFLVQLQVYKSTADAAAGMPWYDGYSAVPDAWLPLRDLVVAKRKPRQMFVQPLLEAAGGGGAASDGSRIVTGTGQSSVQLRVFPATVEGVVSSFVRRFPTVETELLAAWEAGL